MLRHIRGTHLENKPMRNTDTQSDQNVYDKSYDESMFVKNTQQDRLNILQNCMQSANVLKNNLHHDCNKNISMELDPYNCAICGLSYESSDCPH